MATMHHLFSVRTTGFLSLALLALAACSSDDAPPNPATEFIATNADFAGYASWTRVAGPLIGPDPSGFEGGFHLGSDSSKMREVFMNNPAAVRGSNGEFANGIILAKRVSDTLGNARFTIAMAKRGSGFNSGHKGWEWFLLDPATGAIQQRGDSLAGDCNGCHKLAARDYVFSK